MSSDAICHLLSAISHSPFAICHMPPAIRYKPLGDSAINIEFGDQIDPDINQRVHDFADLIQRDRLTASSSACQPIAPYSFITILCS